VHLLAVDPGRDAAPLLEATRGEGADPRLWDFLPYGPFADAAGLRGYLRGLVADPDVVPLVVLDGDMPAGVVTYLRLRPAHGSVEIGHIWFAGRVQRSPVGTEAISLLLQHAFDDLDHRRVEWKCDAANTRSRAAAERYGFTYEGTFRQDMVVKGRNRDTAWYSLLDREWPAAKAAFAAYMADARAGARPRPLAQLRAEAARS
jgi:RimJ/RimL family protein N-acetyltransferase